MKIICCMISESICMKNKYANYTWVNNKNFTAHKELALLSRGAAQKIKFHKIRPGTAGEYNDEGR